MQNRVLTYLSITFFVSCSPDLPEDGNFLKWSTNIEIPLFTDFITLETLAEDSLISIENLSNYFQDGDLSDSIFVYHKQINIEKVEVGNKLKLDPISTSFSQSIDDVSVASIEKNISSKIGMMTLNDIDPTSTDPFVFRDIYPEIEEVPNGTMVSIPSFEIIPIFNSFTFDDFASANFSQGLLELTIENSMVIPIGTPLVIELLEVILGDTINIPGAFLQFDTIIDANNGSATGTMDLTNVSLPGEILVKVSGNCQGTSGVPIFIDEQAKNSGFVVSIGGSGLEVSEANAKIPQQSIEENGTISLAPDSNKVVNALIESGQLLIEIDNYMELSSTLNISIPNLEDPAGNMFSTSLDILSNTFEIINLTNLSGYSLLMDPNDQSVQYNYDVLTVDSGENFILVTSNDSINVKIGLQGIGQGSNITFSEFTGYLSQDAMLDSNSINLESATRVDEAILNSGQLELSIMNNIGIEAVVNFSINELTKNGSALDTSFLISDQPSLIFLDLAGYTLNLVPDLNPQTVNYVSSIDIPSGELISLSFGQSIMIDVKMDSLSFSEISGYVDPVVVEIDSIEQQIDLPDEIRNLDFSIINMEFSFQSSLMLPVFLNLELLSINDETGEIYRKIIDDINITETPNFYIDSVEQLINIKPNRIIATGNTKIGSLNDFGSVSTSDSLSGILKIAAPLAFEIDENSEIELDPEEFKAVEIEDLISATLFIDYRNELELGADISILMATDTNFFYTGQPDTLAKLTIQSSQTNIDSIILDETHFDLLAREGNYIKTLLKILGNNDKPTRFLSTDTIGFSAYLKSEVIVDPNASE